MRTRSSAAALALAVAFAALLGPVAARAHDASSPLAVAIDLERTRVGAYLRYTVERGEDARALREQFDRDADGSLDDEERARLRAWLVERARAAFEVRVAGAALVFAQKSVADELDGGADARLAVALRLVAPVKWPAGSATLSVAVELPDARAITPVAVRVEKTASLGLPEGFAGGVASRRTPLEVQVTSAGVSGRRRQR